MIMQCREDTPSFDHKNIYIKQKPTRSKADESLSFQITQIECTILLFSILFIPRMKKSAFNGLEIRLSRSQTNEHVRHTYDLKIL